MTAIFNRFSGEPTQLTNFANVSYDNTMRNYPFLFKVSTVGMHVIRTIPMLAMMKVLPYSQPVNFGIALAGSLAYRIGGERCEERYTVQSCLTAGAVMLAKDPIKAMISRAAMRSLETFALNFVRIIPLVICAVYIAKSAHDYVNRVVASEPKKPCCDVPEHAKADVVGVAEEAKPAAQ